MNIHIHFSAKDFSTESSFIFWKTGSETRLITAWRLQWPWITLDGRDPHTCVHSSEVVPASRHPVPTHHPLPSLLPPRFLSFPFHFLERYTTYILCSLFLQTLDHTNTHLTNNHTAWFIAMHSIWCSQKYIAWYYCNKENSLIEHSLYLRCMIQIQKWGLWSV